MTSRFSNLQESCIVIQRLIPKYVVSATYADLKQSIDFYANDLQQESIVLGEFERWKLRWTKVICNI
jgi:hypothetical protein